MKEYCFTVTKTGWIHVEADSVEDAINDTLAMIQQSTLGDIENNIEDEYDEEEEE